MINIKGVGAWANGEYMILDKNNWYLGSEGWKPFHEVMNKSLGRRWGILDKYAAEKEFNNNLFEDSGIAQVPHLKLNHVPEEILPFSGITQLVRGLNTNIRCDQMIPDTKLQEQYISPKTFSYNDIKMFEKQKNLYMENKGIAKVGRISDNRYIDGKITDMENYYVTQKDNKEELLQTITMFCEDLIGSAFIAMSEYEDGRKEYLETLENKTGVQLSNLITFNPIIFMDHMMNRELFDKEYRTERLMFRQQFSKYFEKYISNQ
jgi:hypothetical protein